MNSRMIAYYNADKNLQTLDTQDLLDIGICSKDNGKTWQVWAEFEDIEQNFILHKNFKTETLAQKFVDRALLVSGKIVG